MITDANQIQQDLETDVCIIGAGAAGIALALKLDRAGISAVVLAGGGEKPDDAHQQLQRIRQIGIPTDDPGRGNVMAFGGTLHRWGGYCRPLDPIDFEARPWIPHSGWPITRAELDPYYEQAHQLCEIDSPDYDPAHHLTEEQTRRGYFLRNSILENVVILVYPIRFGERYRPELHASPHIGVLLYAVATQIESDAAGRHATAVQCKTLGGRAFRVRARRVVLAAGALQNARLLLCSRGARPEGLGNPHDVVGRFFMQHPVFPHASLLAVDPDGPLRLGRDGASMRIGIPSALTEALQRRERLPNAHFLLAGFDNDSESIGFRAGLQRSWRHAQRVYFAPEAGQRVPQLASFLERQRSSTVFTSFGPVMWRPEQAPNPASRITLGNDADALGVPIAVMDWRLTDLDWEFVDRGLKWLGCCAGAEGIGRLRTRSAAARAENEKLLRGGFHYFGTTRMSTDPSFGVVDQNCKVHGVDNLYVAGSGVFPTGGYANPTLTIIALAARLAGHLQANPATR